MAATDTLLQIPTLLYSQPVSSTASLTGKYALKNTSSFVTTTTPAAILIHNVSNQRCVASIPATSGASFTAPAIFVALPNQDTVDSGSDDDHPISGHLVSASGSSIHIWNINSTLIACKVPEKTKKLDSRVHAISVVHPSDDAEKVIVVVLESGQVHVLSFNLDHTLALWDSAMPKVPLSTSTVVYSSANGPSSDIDHTSIVQVVKHVIAKGSRLTYTCRVLIMTQSNGKHVVTLTNEFILGLPTIAANAEFAFDSSSTHLAVVATTGVAFTFDLSSDSKQPSTMTINMMARMDSQKMPGAPAFGRVSIAILSEHHIAILSQKGQLDTVSIWETKYGSLQTEANLNEVDTETSMRGTRVLSLAICDTPAIGKAMIALVSNSSSSIVSTTAYILPYHCAPVTLLSAIGRCSNAPEFKDHGRPHLVTPLATIVATLPPTTYGKIGSKSNRSGDVRLDDWVSQVKSKEASSAQFLIKLADKKQTPTASIFHDVFSQWIANTNESENLMDVSGRLAMLPSGGLSHAAVTIIANRCFEDPSKFWPRTVVEQLIVSGALTSQSVGGEGLIPALILKLDYDLIDQALRRVCDISEIEYVHLLRNICATDPATSSKRLAAMEAFMKRRKANKKRSKTGTDQDTVTSDPSMEVTTTTPNARSNATPLAITKGQRYFFKGVFLAARNDLRMVKALRSLGVQELEVLVVFLSQILCPEFSADLDVESDQFPLWWLWTDDSKKEQKAYDQWLMAVDALALLIDSNLSTLILSTEISPQIEHLQSIVKRDLRLLQLYESRLRGPLTGLSQERSSHEHSSSMLPDNNPMNTLTDEQNIKGSERIHGARWKRLLDHVQSGTGDYSVEVLKLQY
ncbi:hypothetical protein BASA83_004987 [Batrachochytrium salamandrivorans]|nr:hypothetical protein BASA81_004562 [Batrachochytrium salamandrivorans]KAH9272783.1 hypothetical protein BASA83_004987 [Batrachochytrium salamandrivorans]